MMQNSLNICVQDFYIDFLSSIKGNAPHAQRIKNAFIAGNRLFSKILNTNIDLSYIEKECRTRMQQIANTMLPANNLHPETLHNIISNIAQDKDPLLPIGCAADIKSKIIKLRSPDNLYLLASYNGLDALFCAIYNYELLALNAKETNLDLKPKVFSAIIDIANSLEYIFSFISIAVPMLDESALAHTMQNSIHHFDFITRLIAADQQNSQNIMNKSYIIKKDLKNLHENCLKFYTEEISISR